MFRKAGDKIASVFAGILAFGFVGSAYLIGLVVTPFYMLYLKAFNLGPKPVDPAILDEYDRVAKALEDSDIAFLEIYANGTSEFPEGVDRWLGRHWLTNAIDLGSLVSVQWFLDQGVGVNYQDDEGYSPIKSAIERGGEFAICAVEMLLKSGAEVNARGTLDVTPLHLAAAFGSLDVVQLLLDHGANPLALDSEFVPGYPVSYANKRKSPHIVALLEHQMKIYQGLNPDTGRML